MDISEFKEIQSKSFRTCGNTELWNEKGHNIIGDGSLGNKGEFGSSGLLVATDIIEDTG